jgi:hypothetical protein
MIDVMIKYSKGFEIEESGINTNSWSNAYNPTWNWETKMYRVKDMKPIIKEAIEKGAEIEYRPPEISTWRHFDPMTMDIYDNLLYRIKDDKYTFSVWNKYSKYIKALEEGKRVQQKIGENWIDIVSDQFLNGVEYRIVDDEDESFEDKLERIKNELDEVEIPKVETITVEKDFLDKILDKLEICCKNKEN